MNTKTGKNGGRYYEVEEGKFYPSVTTIMGAMTDKSWLVEWENRIGKSEADKISKNSAQRGTFMHALCEEYLDLKFDESFSGNILRETFTRAMNHKEVDGIVERANLITGKDLFVGFLEDGTFNDIKEVVIQEIALYCPVGGGYAGRVDLIAITNDGLLKVIDFKSSNRPKQRDKIDNYHMQIAAYSFAYYMMTGNMPKGGEIWICNQLNKVPQVFKLNEFDLKHWYGEFILLVRRYHEQFLTSNEV